MGYSAATPSLDGGGFGAPSWNEEPSNGRFRSALKRLGGVRLLLLLIAPAIVLLLVTIVINGLGIVTWDSPAHLYKVAKLDSFSSIFWDNNWYGGAYDVISYGFLFYVLAAVVSHTAIVVLSAGAMPVLFYLYMRRTYGDTSYLPAASLVLVLTVYLANGQDPFVLAMALMLGSMVLLAYRHPLLAMPLAAASIFANPLALIVGVVFLLADFLARPDRRPLYRRALLYLSPVLLVRLLLGLIFYEPASYTYDAYWICLFVGFGALGYIFARVSQDPERRAKGILFVTFAGVAAACAAIPGNPVGSNVGRFFFLFAVPLVIGIRRLMLPTAVVAIFTIAVACGQMLPPAANYVRVSDQPSTRSEFFAPALSFAANHHDFNYRIHVVALQTHWEAYYFSINDFAITRGWYRQADALHNEVLSEEFTGAEYIAWLREMGVKYVYLPNAPLDASGPHEAEILGASPAFSVAWRNNDWTVYELADPSPIAVAEAGGVNPKVMALPHQGIRLQVPKAGTYLIKVTYSRFWHIAEGTGTLTQYPGSGDFLELHASTAGVYDLRVEVSLGSSLQQLVRML